MFSAATIKFLLLVALSMGSGDASNIQITTGTTNFVCFHKMRGWDMVETGEPTPDLPSKLALGTPKLKDCPPEDAANLRAIMHHDWSHDSVLFLENGDRVEKNGANVFYTFQPGSANEKVFTITSNN